MSDDFSELENRLREAHSFPPPPGLQAEIRSRLQPEGRSIRWAAFSAAAAVLIAVVGVGYLLSHSAVHGPAAGASSASRSTALAFGQLPRLSPLRAEQVTSGAAAQARPATPGVGAAEDAGLLPRASTPTAALVFRWRLAGSYSPPCSPAPVPFVYPSVGGIAPCGQPLERATYRLAAAPDGAQLVYVGVADGAFGYFEPAYLLPDGSIATALTPDELRG